MTKEHSIRADKEIGMKLYFRMIDNFDFFVCLYLCFNDLIYVVCSNLALVSGSRISHFLSFHIRLLRAHAQEGNSTKY